MKHNFISTFEQIWNPLLSVGVFAFHLASSLQGMPLQRRIVASMRFFPKKSNRGRTSISSGMLIEYD
ncbi:MAG TPA: hypothetical protein DCE71_06710 [Parachlamydiales bacterium]|nr:hypothetical protein [Parachlamydiales bacterium]